MDNLKNKGFTLVEMAIVLSIIALLIGGTLKGAEMVQNASITSTIASLNGSQVAFNKFIEIYRAYPGDMSSATTKVKGCNAANFCADGNGDKTIHNGNSFSYAMDGAGPTTTNTSAEMWLFWKHLALSEIIVGVDASDNGTEDGVPVAEIGGVLLAGTSTGGTNCGTGPNFKLGVWIAVVTSRVEPCWSSNTFAAKPISIIDRKIDDGMPNSGGFRAGGTTPNASCIVTFNSQDIYNLADESAVCSGSFFVR